jgi:hypothetical protein
MGPLRRLLDDGRPLRLRHDSAGMAATSVLPDDPNPRSLFFIPLSHQAALILVERLGAAAFSASDERFAVSIAPQLRLSYENANPCETIRLIDQTEGDRGESGRSCPTLLVGANEKPS